MLRYHESSMNARNGRSCRWGVNWSRRRQLNLFLLFLELDSSTGSCSRPIQLPWYALAFQNITRQHAVSDWQRAGTVMKARRWKNKKRWKRNWKKPYAHDNHHDVAAVVALQTCIHSPDISMSLACPCRRTRWMSIRTRATRSPEPRFPGQPRFYNGSTTEPLWSAQWIFLHITGAELLKPAGGRQTPSSPKVYG